LDPTITQATTIQRRFAGLALVAGVVCLAGWFWWTSSISNGTPFLRDHQGARWIVYPRLTDLGSSKPLPMTARFLRSLDLAQRPASAMLKIRAFRSAEVRINDVPVLSSASLPRWKDEQTYDVTAFLNPGENRVTVDVTNDYGPPAVWAVLELPEATIGTDSSWQVALAGAAELPAQLARDGVIDPEHAESLPSPMQAVRSHWRSLVLVFAISCIVAVVVRGPLPRSLPLSPAGVMFVLLLAGWSLLFWHNRPYLAANYGFDVVGHLEYIDYVEQHWRLPLANQGWEMFQPPLFYMIAAASLHLTGTSAGTESGITVLRFLGLAFGIVQLTALFGSFRLLFPKRTDLQAIALLVGGLLPAQLYLFQYVSNEGLLIATCSVAIWQALRLLQQPTVSFGEYAVLGILLGMALLTKLTALVVVVVVLSILTARGFLEITSGGRRLLGVALTTGLLFLVAGWHYLRAWNHFGTPLVANWDPQSGFGWWQLPGYQTPASSLRLGHVFHDPYFAGVYGLWDGVYSTLWGDGGLGGSTEIWSKPPWNYAFMSMGYLLAILPSTLALAGLLITTVRLLRRPTAEGFLLLGLAAGMSFAILQMNLKLPYYSLAKGFFGLPACVSLCALVAIGYGLVAKWSRWLSHACVIGLGMWGVLAYGSFWVSPSSPETLRSMATGLLNTGGAKGKPAELLMSLLKLSPEDGHAWTLLAVEAAKQGNVHGAEQYLRRALDIDPKDAGALLGLAILASGKGETDRAFSLARQASDLEPDYLSAWALLGQLHRQANHPQDAINAYREALRIEPYDPGAHAALGQLYQSQGVHDRSLEHLQYAVALDSESAELRVNLADAYAQQGDWPQAIAQAEAALNLATRNPSTFPPQRIVDKIRDLQARQMRAAP
jgi:cytochrome c-type biogenesis protein CcmH/NrfG